MFRSSCAVGAVAAVAALGSASGASAATIAPVYACNAYLPGSAGQYWVGLTGAGFTANTDPSLANVQVTWSDGSLAGNTPLAADGSFPPSGFLMPTDFIGARSHVKTYTATATDQTTPGLTASTEVNFVKPDVTTSPSSLRSNLARKVTWSVYAAAPGKSVYLHWTFKGKKYATRKLGKADSPCGTLKAKAPFLPVTPRVGTWKVYVSDSKKFSKKKYFFRYDLTVFRTFAKTAVAKPAALKVAPKPLGM